MPGIREKLVEILDESFDHQYDKNLVITARNTANDLIANGVTIQRWIPVTERLPEPFEIVIVYDNRDKYVSDAYMTRHKEWVGITAKSDVTHWMPLPEPPKGE